MREIALDTETTGFDPERGDRIIEIGCVEMMDKIRTGNTFQAYINPRRDVPEGAFKVHGISTSFLLDKPYFEEVAEDFLTFIGNDHLVIHNAEFDLKFLNYELKLLKRPLLKPDRVTDTVLMARRKFPGAPASLDALCKRFVIDLSERTKHGALLDAELLAEVYLELMGGRQASMLLADEKTTTINTLTQNNRNFIPARNFPPTEAELSAHNEFIAKIKNALWTENV